MTPGKLYRLILISLCLTFISSLVLEGRLLSHSKPLDTDEFKADDNSRVEITETFRFPDFGRLSLVSTQPLFYPDRQPLSDEPDEPEITDKAPEKKQPKKKRKPRYQLTGVVIQNDKQFAIIHDTKVKRSETLQPDQGMDNDGTAWILQAINPRQVVIEDQSNQDEEVLELEVFTGRLGSGREMRGKRRNASEKKLSSRKRAAQEKKAIDAARNKTKKR